MRADIYAELFLLNKNIDSLIRVFQRIESLVILPRTSLQEHEARLEELRAALNSELLEAILKREHDDCRRSSVLRNTSEEFRSEAVRPPKRH
jgi:predicted RecB family nuclease